MKRRQTYAIEQACCRASHVVAAKILSGPHKGKSAAVDSESRCGDVFEVLRRPVIAVRRYRHGDRVRWPVNVYDLYMIEKNRAGKFVVRKIKTRRMKMEP